MRSTLATLLSVWLLVLALPAQEVEAEPAYTSEFAPSPVPAVEAEPPAESGFAGLWQTRYGRMRLTERAGEVVGSYAHARGSRIEGSAADGKLEFVYEEPNAKGEGWFRIAEDGNSFRGKWRAEGEERWQNWNGRRVEPEAGRRWLVILEANWETSLAEREYAFGDMLRSYFTMGQAERVAVRHRYFHDVADLQHFCREVSYLAEPVVLLLSTHGSSEGISVGGETIGAEAIADGLREAWNVELLHLSGCDMMRGDVPRRIHEELARGPRFPISGYTTSVAWDASALADFTFLTMLLLRDHEPAEAVDRAIRVSPYLGEGPVERGGFTPLGLRIREAPAVERVRPIEASATRE